VTAARREKAAGKDICGARRAVCHLCLTVASGQVIAKRGAMGKAPAAALTVLSDKGKAAAITSPIRVIL
jgi:hypothetical protein